MERHRSRNLVLAIALVGLLLGAIVAFFAMKKPPDEAPPPPVDPPVAPPSSPVTLTPIEVDAGDAGDAGDDGDARKSGGGPVDVTGLRACCNALAQNAASMPPPNNAYAAAAASYCSATVSSVNDVRQKDAMMSQVRTLLRGSALPGSCR